MPYMGTYIALFTCSYVTSHIFRVLFTYARAGHFRGVFFILSFAQTNHARPTLQNHAVCHQFAGLFWNMTGLSPHILRALFTYARVGLIWRALFILSSAQTYHVRSTHKIIFSYSGLFSYIFRALFTYIQGSFEIWPGSFHTYCGFSSIYAWAHLTCILDLVSCTDIPREAHEQDHRFPHFQGSFYIVSGLFSHILKALFTRDRAHFTHIEGSLYRSYMLGIVWRIFYILSSAQIYHSRSTSQNHLLCHIFAGLFLHMSRALFTCVEGSFAQTYHARPTNKIM